MATILDTFFTRIGFEVDEKGLESATEKITELGKELLGLGAIAGSLAGMFALTAHTAEAMTEIQLLSERSKLATETIAGMDKAGAAFHITAESMNGGLESINMQLGLIAAGAPTRLRKLMEAFGLTAKDAQGKTKDVMTFMGDMADKVKEIESKGGNAQGLIGRLGLDRNMIMMLRQGREAFMDMYETAKESVPWSAEDYENAAKFSLSLHRAEAAISNIGKAISLELMPPMQKFLDEFLAWWKTDGRKMMDDMRARLRAIADPIIELDKNFRDLSGGVTLVAFAMRLLTLAVGAVTAMKLADWAVAGVKGMISLARSAMATAAAMGRSAMATMGFSEALDAEAASMATAEAVTLPMVALGLAIIAVLAALIALILLVIDDFRVWQQGGKSLIGDLANNFPKVFAVIRQAVLVLRDSFLQLWQSIKGLWAVAGPPLMFLLKWLLIIAAVVIGVVLAAIIVLAYGVILAVTKILTWLARWYTFLLKLVPVAAIKAAWQAVTDYVVSTVGEWVAAVEQAVAIIKAIWQTLAAFFAGVTELIGEYWKELTDALAPYWQEFTTPCRRSGSPSPTGLQTRGTILSRSSRMQAVPCRRYGRPWPTSSRRSSSG